MTLDEGVTAYIVLFGEPKFDGSRWTQEEYEFVVWLGEQLGYGSETDYPTTSYTWIQLGYRYKAMKDERDRQPTA